MIHDRLKRIAKGAYKFVEKKLKHEVRQPMKKLREPMRRFRDEEIKSKVVPIKKPGKTQRFDELRGMRKTGKNQWQVVPLKRPKKQVDEFRKARGIKDPEKRQREFERIDRKYHRYFQGSLGDKDKLT